MTTEDLSALYLSDKVATGQHQVRQVDAMSVARIHCASMSALRLSFAEPSHLLGERTRGLDKRGLRFLDVYFIGWSDFETLSQCPF